MANRLEESIFAVWYDIVRNADYRYLCILFQIGDGDINYITGDEISPW